MVDIDARNDGESGLVSMQIENGDLPPTLTVVTGGGRHMYYTVPPGEYRDAPGAWDGVDLKADGFVVAPPSVHHTGAVYRVADPDVPIADAPAWLVARVSGAVRPAVIGGEATLSAMGRAFDLMGWAKAESPDGAKLHVTCPWSSDHTTDDSPGGTDTVIFAGEKGAASPQGWFKCLHGHCSGRTQGDVWDTVPVDTQRAVLEVMSLPAHWRPREARLQLVSGASAPSPEAMGPAQFQPSSSPAGWVHRLVVDRNQDVRGDSLANIIELLRNDARWAGKLGLDVYKSQPLWLADVKFKGAPDVLAGPVNMQADPARIESLLNEYRGHTTAALDVRKAKAAIEAVALETPVNPVTDYLDALAWDGRGRLAMVSRYFNCKGNSIYESEAIRSAVFVAGVARAYEPGMVAQEIVVLEGDQGCGKSYACKILGGDYYGETLRLSGKDDYIQLGRAWVNEIPELVATGRMNDEEKKAFISSPIDTYRRPYGAENEEVPRRFVLIGTTNRDDYLSDPTGSRRFLPIQCGRIDLKNLIDDRDQLWAEAVHLWRGGHGTMLQSSPSIKAQQDVAKRRMPDSSIRDVVEQSGRLVLSTREVRALADQLKGWHSDRDVADALRAHGWRRLRITVRGKQIRGWAHRRATDDDRAGFKTRHEALDTSHSYQ